MPLSSDESSTVDVCMKSSDESLPESPNKLVNYLNLSVELVDSLLDDEENVSTEIIGETLGPAVKFFPLCPENRRITALKFNLVLKPLLTDLVYSGVGNTCKNPPLIKVNALGNRACLFNTMSILLSGRDTYSDIIRHVVCNYISNPVKYSSLKMYIPTQYKSGWDGHM